jgi:hypothetical protein
MSADQAPNAGKPHMGFRPRRAPCPLPKDALDRQRIVTGLAIQRFGNAPAAIRYLNLPNAAWNRTPLTHAMADAASCLEVTEDIERITG